MFFSKKKSWTKVADNINDLAFGNREIIIVEIGEQKICIGRQPKGYIAFAQRCPHAGASMEYGFIDDKGNIGCSQHGIKFSCKNGRDMDDQAYRLKIWEVDVRNDGVFVALD